MFFLGKEADARNRDKITVSRDDAYRLLEKAGQSLEDMGVILGRSQFEEGLDQLDARFVVRDRVTGYSSEYRQTVETAQSDLGPDPEQIEQLEQITESDHYREAVDEIVG